MGRFQKKIRRNLLLDQMKQAAAVNDAALMLRLERAIEKLEAKPRPVGIQPTSMHGKRLAAQDARSAALAARRAAYTSEQMAKGTSTPTACPAAPQPSVEASVAVVLAAPTVQSVEHQPSTAPVEPTARVDALRQAACDRPAVVDEFQQVQAAKAAAAVSAASPVVTSPSPLTRPVSPVRPTIGQTTDPIIIAMLAKIAERDRVAAEKDEKIKAEKVEAARVEAARLEAAKKYRPVRPVLGPNPLLPQADYQNEGCGINSLIERDGYWVEKIVPREGCDL